MLPFLSPEWVLVLRVILTGTLISLSLHLLTKAAEAYVARLNRTDAYAVSDPDVLAFTNRSPRGVGRMVSPREKSSPRGPRRGWDPSRDDEHGHSADDKSSPRGLRASPRIPRRGGQSPRPSG
ncbi:unnamed protein product [Vitrella brassicaformis CCMP3155]|uniref:Uncharacterized protein n=1 Tax=Vitrella brassicaformis (strain CCMP3155) TaxID=1169540 RepID=A0A0G4FA24_VITBC|nr:unnamed protein product [Vitrella brassicaformis CCMP3155]|eukprot:CEM09735.1 unnamed protein product [Vitrella brassicaformis CCMP3155]